MTWQKMIWQKLKWREFYNFDSLFFFLFITSIILIRIPPVYVLPISSNLFSSHSLSKVLFVMLLISITVIKKKVNWGVSTFATSVIFFYFIGQSLSIITAKDLLLFWDSYQNVTSFISIFFLASYVTVQKKNTAFTKYIVILGVIVTLIEFLFGIFSNAFISLGKNFIQQEVLSAYITNILRDRYSLEISLEIFLPFFLFYIFQIRALKNKWRIVLIIASLILTYNSIFSNIRSRILMLLVALIFSLVLYLRSKQPNFSRAKVRGLALVTVFIFFCIFLTATYVSNSLFSFSVVNRILLEDPNNDLGTLNSRVEKINRAEDLFKTSPIFGVGLGNYVYNSKPSNVPVLYMPHTQSQIAYFDTARDLPHNIFSQVLSETGLIGFISYILLMMYFIVKDWLLFKEKEWNILCCFAISSWIFIVYGLFNPASTIFIMGWFWFFRGIIEGSEHNYSIEVTVKPEKK